MDDLSDVVDSMITDSYVVTRQTPSVYVDGRLQDATDTLLTITASVQPAQGRDLQRLPEGSRTMEVLSIYTSSELLTQGASQAPDLIAVNGYAYEVQTVEQWVGAGNYYKALALKVGH
jgi:hypothetical protein